MYKKKCKRLSVLFLSLLFLMSNSRAYSYNLSDLEGDRDNIPPTASFSVTSKKKIDVIVITDYKGEKLGKLQNSITEFKADNLAKYDIRSVVADNLPKIDMGSQSGTYNKAVYGIVGTAPYTANGYSMRYERFNFEEKREMKVCLNPVWIMPGETQPTGDAILPTSMTKTVKSYTKGPDTWKFDVYNFFNSSGMNYSYYPYYLPREGYNDWPIEDSPGINSSYLYKYYHDRSYYSDFHYDYEMSTIPSTLQFTFQPEITFFRNETYPCNNTVRALNFNSADLQARENSNAFYIIALDGSSTDFYQSSIYNTDNSLNYLLGNLRNDNLGKYVKDSNATVLAAVNPEIADINLGNVTENLQWFYGNDDENSDDDTYIKYYANNYNMRFEEDKRESLQNMTLNQLLQSGSDNRMYDSNYFDGAGVVDRLDWFISKSSNQIDLTIVTDKDTNYANNIDSIVKNSVGSSVDVKTTVVDNTSPVKNIGQRTYYNFKDDIILKNSLLRVGDDFNNTWYNLGPLKGVEYTSASYVGTNIKDMSELNSTSGNYLITSGGDLYLSPKPDSSYTNYFKINPEYSSSNYSYLGWGAIGKYALKLDRSCVNNEQVKTWGYTLYGNLSTNVHYSTTPFAIYILTENNNLYFIHDAVSTLVSANVFTVTTRNEEYRPDSYTYELCQTVVGIKRNGEAHQMGYRVPLRKLCSSSGSPIKKEVNGYLITEDNTLYTKDNFITTRTPTETNVSYVSGKYNITLTSDGGLSEVGRVYEDDEEGGSHLIYEYKYPVTIPQGNGVKIEDYPNVGGFFHESERLIKLSDNSVVFNKINTNTFSETNYTDFLYFSTNYRTYSGTSRPIGGTFFKVDREGHVYINVFNNDYYYTGYEEIKLEDNIAEQIVRADVINVESFNNDLIKSVPLREGSDRILLYISDKFRTEVGAGRGTYFPWGDINSDLLNYLSNNKYSVYFITPEQAMSVNFKPPFISNFIGESLNNICYANIYDSYRFDDPGQLSSYLANRYGLTEYLEDPNGIYLVQGEDKLSYNIIYDDYEVDPMNALRWRFNHDPNVFENNQGMNALSGQWLNNFNEEPYQVGKYIIQCQAQDRPIEDTRFLNYWKWGSESEPQNVYVHRRPIADFNIYLSKNGEGYNTNIADNSYDPDRLSNVNRGIAKWKWKYRLYNSTEWLYGQIPTYINKGLIYEVSLEVLDLQGAWSHPKIVIIDTTAVNLIPIVDANPTSSEWTNQDIPINITADDNGENDFNRVTITTSANIQEPGWVDMISYQKTSYITYTYEGIWYLHMRVFDNVGNTSYRNRGPYKIDKTLPGGTATPYESWWSNQDVSVTFTPWDALSGVQKWRYTASSDNGASWGLWSGYAWGPTPATVYFNYQGIHRLVAEVTDNAGNISYVSTGNYLIDKVAPVITTDKTGPLEAFDNLVVNLSISDNLSGVRETKYTFTNSMDKPVSGWITTTSTNIAAAINQEGTWYLHVESVDNAGNTRYMVIGNFNITIIRLYDLTVTMINDITWREFYYEGKDYNSAGKPINFTRKNNTDLKTNTMPINLYNGTKIIDYSRDGIDAGCEVNFYLRSIGNPQNVEIIAQYITEEEVLTDIIQPISFDSEMWAYKYTIPLKCKIGTYINFSVRAFKNGNVYGNNHWHESWLPLNNDRNVFYISGNILDRLKFNQSH